MNIGKAMRVIREEAGLTRKELAIRLKCTASCLCKIENGKVWPKKETIDSFCVVMGCPPAYLYTMAFTKEDFIPAFEPILVIDPGGINEPPKERTGVLFVDK